MQPVPTVVGGRSWAEAAQKMCSVLRSAAITAGACRYCSIDWSEVPLKDSAVATEPPENTYRLKVYPPDLSTEPVLIQLLPEQQDRLQVRFECYDCDWDGNAIPNDMVRHYANNKKTKFEHLQNVFVISECFVLDSPEHPQPRPLGITFVAFLAYPPSPPTALRVNSMGFAYIKYLSFNLWVGGGLSLQSCVDVMRATEADVISLQEATPLTVELVANELRWACVDVEACVLTSLNASLARVASQRLLITVTEPDSDPVELTVANIHLPAYPYPPYEALKKGVKAALESEGQLQLQELQKIMSENRLAELDLPVDDAEEETPENDETEFAEGGTSITPCRDRQSDHDTSDSPAPVDEAELHNMESRFASLQSSPVGRSAPEEFPNTSASNPLRPPLASPTARVSRSVSALRSRSGRTSASGRLDIMGGDFNCPSHLDTCWNPTKRSAVNIPWQTSQECERVGFVDTFRHRNEEPSPEVLVERVSANLQEARRSHAFYSWSPMHGRERHGCYDRIDFVYARRTDENGQLLDADDVVLECCHIDETPGGEPWPSDHRAVLATLRVK